MQTEIQTQMGTPIEIMPEFLSELEKIAGEYIEAKKRKDQLRVDQFVDSHFRRLLEKQCEDMKKLSRLKTKRSLAGTDWDLFEKRYVLESLTYYNKAWKEFSQKLKDGNFTEFPQIGYAS